MESESQAVGAVHSPSSIKGIEDRLQPTWRDPAAIVADFDHDIVFPHPASNTDTPSSAAILECVTDKVA